MKGPAQHEQRTSDYGEILGTQTPVIIKEPQLGKRGKQGRAQLRSIPFLMELGLEKFLYDDLWAREFQLVEHSHLRPKHANIETPGFPIAHLATSDQLLPRHQQEFEHEDISQADTTWELLRSATNEESGGFYVLITDTDSPEIPSRTPVRGRSATDQFDGIPYSYEGLFRDYLRDHVNSKIPMDYTKNLYFHRVSEYHAEHGAPASSILELFEYEEAPPDSPVWEPLHFFLEHELQDILEEYEAHITTALRSWVERGDTEKIARKMIAMLHACNFDQEKLTKQQNSDI
jgi:hypothetical protein